MSTNKDILNQGIKYLVWALPLLFIGPSIIHNAFINKENSWHYLVLAIGIIICGFGIYYMIKGLKTIVKSLFGN